jgi:hypothetical protein
MQNVDTHLGNWKNKYQPLSGGMKSGKELSITPTFGNEGGRMERALPQEFGTESGDRPPNSKN